MTSKGLVIGDSHAGMLVDALQCERSGALSAIDMDFFVQPGKGPKGFAVQGTRLVPTDTKLVAFLDKISAPPSPDLAEYDFAIIVGCGLSIYPAVQAMGSVSPVGSGKAKRQETRYGTSGLTPCKYPLVSGDCYHRIVRDRLSGSLAFSILGAVSNATNIPLYVLPQPRPRSVLRTLSGRGVAFSNTLKSGDGHLVSIAFDDAVKSLSQSTATCRVLTQDEETTSDHIFTREQFCTGAFRLSNPGMRQAKRDVLHANAQYGTLVLKQLCALSAALMM